MELTRRQAGLITGGAAMVAGAPTMAWTAEWDRAIVEAAVTAADANYDPAAQMLGRRVGDSYNYHSALRNRLVHPTRESLAYALMLLEAGGPPRLDRASRIVDRVISIQETDPAGRFYGIWGYYLEEPAPSMSPADFNWADFNGSLLLLIEYRHGAKLSAALRKRVLESIRHAAYSVKRRNVSMNYTNIAVQGTFVTLAAAQLLGDRELWAYATERQQRFAKTVAETGSFAEYNSPTYCNVSIVNFTRIRMLVKDPAVLALNAKLHALVWRHLGEHWHVPTHQLAGPMSRSYATDIGAPLWLQKSLGGRLGFASLEEVKARKLGGDGEIGVVDYRCPEELAPLFLRDRPPREHREQFTASVQGTTYLAREFSLGSSNRGNFWIQQRPLVAYWGGPARPARYAQLRFMHDDYDFSSALLYTTQERNRVMGLVNFRNPGGDKHVSIDMIKTGEFTAKSLRLRLDIADPLARVDVTGDRAAINASGRRLVFHLRGGMFGTHKPVMRAGTEDGRAAVIVDLLASSEAVLVKWAGIAQAWLAFTFTIDDVDPGPAFQLRAEANRVRMVWDGMELTGAATVADIKTQDAAYAELRDGKPVPMVRLRED